MDSDTDQSNVKALEKRVPARKAVFDLARKGTNVLVIALGGDWLMKSKPPAWEPMEKELKQDVQRIEFDPAGLGLWDSGLVSFVLKCHEFCQRGKIDFADETLPAGVHKLVRLATAVPETKDARR